MKKLLSLLILGSAFVGCNEQKTAYVDTAVLIQEYSEMKEVEAEFTARSEKVRKELDSVAKAFQQEVAEFQQEMGNMSEAERQETQQQLMQKQQMLQRTQQQQTGQLRQESDMVIDSLVNKVKDFVQEYGEKNNYTYIFGSNESANIMYAKEGLDITDEILEKLNAGAEVATDSVN